MIRLIDTAGEHHPLYGYENFQIKHKEDGNDTMSFLLDTRHELYPYIQNECTVITDENEWLVKKIDDDKIDCQLNFDFLKSRVYTSYRSETRSLSEVLLDHLPSDWAFEGGNVSSILRTIEFDCCTDYDVVMECMKTYNVRFIWNIRRKLLTVCDPEKMMPTGEYLTSELNLRRMTFKGSSTDFATRLYGYGADNLTAEDAMVDDGNGGTVRYGLPYVEDRTYSDKVVCAYWKDERYTVPENLYEAMREMVSSMAAPVVSYECDVLDLAKVDPRYSFLDFGMFKKITIVDVDRHTKVEYQILEYVEWPDDPDSNSVTLSSVPSTIKSVVKNQISGVVDEVDKNAAVFDQKIMMATAMLTGAFGGHIITNGSEVFIMDTEDPATAEIVWRWNINGFGKSSTGIDGPYTSTLTFDDTFITNLIQAMVIKGSYIEADSIQAMSISQSFTDGVLKQSYEAAEGLIKSTFDQMQSYLSNDLGTGQLDVLNQTVTEIRQTLDGLELDFTETYSGGVNYVTNSAGLNATEGWEYQGTLSTLQDDDTKNSTVSNSAFRLSGDAVLRQIIDNVIVGNSYAVSVKIKKTGNLLAELKIVYNGSSEAVIYSSSDSCGWTEFSYVLQNVQSNTVEIVATTRDDFLYIADLMVCEGTAPKPWTPAPNEMYTSGTRIDKTGIQVFRGDDEKTLITNKEFAGYYRGERVFSVNKDETRLQKAAIEKELTVGDCTFAPYESDSDAGINIVLVD